MTTNKQPILILLTMLSTVCFLQAASIAITIADKSISIKGSGPLTGTLLDPAPTLSPTNGLLFQDETNFAGGRNINFMYAHNVSTPASPVYRLLISFLPTEAYPPSTQINETGVLTQGSVPANLLLLSNYQLWWTGSPTLDLATIDLRYEFTQSMESRLLPGNYSTSFGGNQLDTVVSVVPETSVSLLCSIGTLLLLRRRRTGA